MKSMVYYGPGDVRYESVPDPVRRDQRSAIVRIRACSICGSDLHPYHVHPGVSGFCIGHEAIGEVVEVGRQVHGFKPGDQVLVPGTICCGRCKACEAGFPALCEIPNRPLTYGMGGEGVGGCQAEAVEVTTADLNLAAMPSEFSDEVGVALTDTLGTAWAGAKAGGVRQGVTVAVIGLGAVGLQTVLAAFAQGASAVYAMDLIEDRREAARAFGAIPVAGDSVVEQIIEATGGHGVDVVVDANGSEQTMAMALQIVKKAGCVAVTGVPEAITIAIPAGLAIAKSVRINYVVVSVQAHLQEMIEALRNGALSQSDVTSIFTHHMPLAEGEQAYRLFDERRQGVKKILLRC